MAWAEISQPWRMTRWWLTRRYASALHVSTRSLLPFECLANCLTQSEYANKLLYIATLALAKLSIISLMIILTASDLHRKLGTALTAFIAVWGVASELAAAFQCGVVVPWHSFGPGSSCFSLVILTPGNVGDV
jgi:hypothetical protein